MATSCGRFNPHAPHPWAIEANPGEDGPDLFWCDGLPAGTGAAPAPVSVPLGPVDTSEWTIWGNYGKAPLTPEGRAAVARFAAALGLPADVLLGEED
jgi:hypothetical protein